MKRLILYSDQIQGESKLMDKELLEILKTDNPKIGYIPSASDVDGKYFNEKVEYYKDLGINNLLYFDLDQEFDENKIEDLLSCDAIHLSGGNTFNFLHTIKKRNFVKTLLDYVQNGGILIGISAGSILMSETILAAALGDENKIGLKDLSALGLVNFEFFPHWNNDKDYLQEVVNYSRKYKNRICYLCNDSDGIIVNNNEVKMIGEPVKLLNGEIV